MKMYVNTITGVMNINEVYYLLYHPFSPKMILQEKREKKNDFGWNEDGS